MTIPQSWVAGLTQRASEMRLFGTPVHELTREEAIAAVVFLGDELMRARGSHASTLEVWSLSRRARAGP